MESLDILIEMITPPSPAVAMAIENGLLAIDAKHVSPEMATALLQHLCTQAPIAAEYVEAGEAIFQRLLDLGGDPWGKALPGMADAATAALQQEWAGPVVKALACARTPLTMLVVNGTPWLRFSVQHELHTVAAWLLEAGIDPNTVPGSGTPLLHEARDSRMVKLLLNYGADPCATDPAGQLCVACWTPGPAGERADMLACLLDRGPGLDRFSLLRLAGGRPGGCKNLLEGIKHPRRLTDEHGRSLFFHMAAAALDQRCGSGRNSSHKQILYCIKEALSWRQTDALDDLDQGAAQLLLWVARTLPSRQSDAGYEETLTQLEASCGLPAVAHAPEKVLHEKALASLDAMVESGLVHDPSEVAATALDGLWKAVRLKLLAMEIFMDPDRGYPALKWLDRCFRGVAHGPWAQGQHDKHRWRDPDVPIEGFSEAFLDFARNQLPALRMGGATHPMWSQPDMARVLIQLLRGSWPGSTRYYQVTLDPLGAQNAARLRKQHAPLLAQMDPQALQEALVDPCCRASVMAMDGKNCHIQALCAQLVHNEMDAATPWATEKPRSGLRL